MPIDDEAGDMSAGGLEVPIAKAAASAASRAVSPLWHRAAQARSLQQVTDMLDLSEVAMPELTPAQAACIAGYVASRDFHVVAVQLALSAYQELNGRLVTVPDAAITGQLTEGLRARREWAGGTLRQIVEVLWQALDYEINASLHQAKAVGSSAARLASALANVGDQAAAAVRNSALLERLSSLEAVHRFESDLREQIRALSQNMRVPNAGGLRFVAYDALYVEPVLDLSTDVRPGDTRPECRETVSRSDLLEVSDRTVILGDPGGGKSTLAAKTVHDLAGDPAAPVPLLLVLRDYVEAFRAGQATVAEYLTGLCRSPYQVEPPPDALEYLLLNGRAVVIFDGLDEVFEPSVRAKVTEAIHGFAHRYPNTPMLVTSRKVGYDESPLDATLFPVRELREFSTDQVAEYARKWFALDQSSLADKFLAESGLVADLRTNPLMLSLMCGLYRAEGYIPANRPDVYEKCALLLFERWDKQRGIVVPLPFDAHVRQAIQSLAWWLYTEPGQLAGLTRARLQEFMTEFLHRERFANRADAENAAASFIDFCTGRAWVLSKTGVRGDQEVFGFTHRTFLEYFAATHMVRRYPDAARLFGQLEPHLRQSDWDVVGQLALQALNRSVENGANDFLDVLIGAAGHSNPHERSNLLAFAARALEFVVPNPVVLRRVVSAIVTFFLDMPDAEGNPQVRYLMPRERLPTYDYCLLALHWCTSELKRDIGRTVVESIAAALGREPVSDNALLICEDPAFFLGSLPGQDELDALSASYNSRLLRQPFIWHDVRRSLDNTFAISELIDRHGVRALYLTVCFATATGALKWASSYAEVVAADAGRRGEMSELVQSLLSCASPWIVDTVILADLKVPILDGLKSLHQADVSADAAHFAAVLLLALPLLECLADQATQWPRMAELDDMAVMCRLARSGRMSAQRVRDMLAAWAMPADVADFVVRWADRQFDLVAGSHLDDGE